MLNEYFHYSNSALIVSIFLLIFTDEVIKFSNSPQDVHIKQFQRLSFHPYGIHLRYKSQIQNSSAEMSPVTCPLIGNAGHGAAAK